MRTIDFITEKRMGLLDFIKKEDHPYHLNVLDKLDSAGNNENAHSRFLSRLLQYQDANKEFVGLKSFIKTFINKDLANNVAILLFLKKQIELICG